MARSGVLVVGSANMDLVVNVGRFPRPGETLMGRSFKMFPGGKGANQAVASAKLGCPTTFIGKMGDDDFQKRLCGNMKNDGVCLDHLLIDPVENTGTALITVDADGENEIIVISGSNMKLTADDVRRHEHIFRAVRVVLTQLEIPVETVIETARLSRKHGAIFILNPAPAREIPDTLLAMVDYLTPNETELAILSGQSVDNPDEAVHASQNLLDCGVQNVIVTMGGKGAFFVNQAGSEHFPVRKVKAVDSTGAGDAFNGGLACALSSGKDIRDAIRFAHAVAALSVTRPGAQSSMPGKQEIVI